MRAEIVMIGTELLLGEIVDTNANLLAVALRDIGIDLYYKTTVGDNEERIAEVLNLALDRSDAVITSGGIGPTVDDVTRQAIARATGRKLIYSEELERQIAARFRNFGRKMAANNKRQAYLPEGALPLENPVGTAPCFLSEDTGGRGFIVCLPGVPRELAHMTEYTVVPLLVERMGGVKVIRVRVLRTCAVGESNIDRGIGDLMTSSNPTVGLAAHAGQTDARIAARAGSEADAEAMIAGMEAELRSRLGVAVYGVDKETVAEVVGGLLSKRDLKLGVVDTLTGGQLSRELNEAGFESVIASDLYGSHADQAVVDACDGLQQDGDERTLAGILAEQVAPEGGVGLAMIGPLAGRSTAIAVRGPGDLKTIEVGRRFEDSDLVRRWTVMLGLDRVRRAVLGVLESPVDWN
ncbi:MAG: CinA family nicotinamide mononucleotide deamidase-related protein [Gemmatimonadota bacterium]|nr:CinA family nicotinamide mononucleotide deamidase-related protein [Gemmatimonadota bacterium]